MTDTTGKVNKKEVMKDIILKLHQGLPANEAKERFEREVGTVSSSEIAAIEQSLINEGLSPDEIKKFCNVHALIFQSALEKTAAQDVFPAHPVYLFKLENREVEKISGSIKDLLAHKTEYSLPSLKEKLGELLQKLKGIDRHYERKEQLLFPYLEKQGFMGPSKVMWGKDNEVRDLFRAALQELPAVKTPAELDAYIDKNLNKLIEEVEGMIFKEENILFPTCLEKLSPSDWVEILRESDDIGYVFIQKPEETEVMVKSLRAALQEEALVQDGTISFPTGSLRLDELLAVMNTLPIDMTFVDKDDRVRYFSEGKSRVFHRTKSVIERRVQNCHPPQSVDVVEKILNAFKEGKKDSYSFWLNYQGKFVYIQYFAVRDREGRYLGTMEVTQDISEITQLKGEKRLLDERD